MKRQPKKMHLFVEAEIKALLITHLRKAKIVRRGDLLVNEFKLGTSQVRCDLVVFGRDLVGVEVKGPRDSLRRIETQIAAYQKYFDRVMLILASRHLGRFPFEKFPEVEVWEFYDSGKITLVRAGCSKAEPHGRLRDLMTRKEVLRHLPNLPEDDANPTINEREAFKLALAERFGRTSAEFWNVVGRRHVQPHDLLTLSRFRGRRDKQASLATSQTAFWHEWARQAERALGTTAPRYSTAVQSVQSSSV
jgi:hypothetical protein